MGIVRIEKLNLADEVYNQMRRQIETGQWKEGEKIASEHKLCELFNVSRVVIREALQRLRGQCFIVTRRGMGSFVSNPRNASALAAGGTAIPISEKDFISFLEFRMCIEFRAIELSVQKATAEDYKAIMTALRKLKNSGDNLEEFSLADVEFHAAIVECAHNIFFSLTMQSCREKILFFLREMNRINDSRRGIEIHQAVADYIIAKDAKNAIKVLRKNNNYNLARLAKRFKGHKSL